MPDDAREYRRTRTFSEATVPAKLLADHQTKAGVWARIVVESGQLRFRTKAPSRDVVLTPDRPGVVEPEAVHDVTPLGPVRFHVEFWRRGE
jgi:tellurite resistance-related uncharacterized protein